MTENLTCENCKEQKPDVCWQVDPYMHELHDDEELHLLCDECCYEIAMDI